MSPATSAPARADFSCQTTIPNTALQTREINQAPFEFFATCSAYSPQATKKMESAIQNLPNVS